MKYLVRCNLSDKSIRELLYFTDINNKNNKLIKNRINFNIPVIEFICNNYSKKKLNLLQKFQKIQTFRVNFSDIKFNNNYIYLLIDTLGFLSMIKRVLKEDLSLNEIHYNDISKWGCFYIEYMHINDKASIDLNKINFPNYVKISGVDILTYSNKKGTLIDSIKLKNI